MNYSCWYASLTVGICLMMVYDGLRLFRTLIPHGNFWTGIEDAVYWAGSSITTFLLLFGQNDGILRWYRHIRRSYGNACL